MASKACPPKKGLKPLAGQKNPEVSLHFNRGRDSESLPFPTCSKVGEQQPPGWCEKGWSVGIPGRSRSIPTRLFRFHQVSRDDAVGIGGLVEIDGLDSWQQGAEMVRQGCACLQRVLHGATRPEKAKGASVGAYGASVVSWMFPKKNLRKLASCMLHLYHSPNQVLCSRISSRNCAGTVLV